MTQNSSSDGKSDLRRLHAMFVENFNYVNFFIATKHEEIVKMIDSIEEVHHRVQCSDEPPIWKHIQLDELMYHCLTTSNTIKKLSLFMLIQKIACKKILKKFVKHYKNKDTAQRFTAKLMYYLQNNKASLINFSLTETTKRLTEITTTIKEDRKVLKNSASLSHRTKSLASLYSYPQSETVSLESRAPGQQYSGNPGGRFDLIVNLKKNFSLDFLMSNDSNTFNATVLYLNVFLDLESYASPTLMSIVYLQNEDMLKEPSYILSYEGDMNSILVSHVGGLRKYAYCSLPNYILDLFLSRSVEEDPAKLADITNKIRIFFQEERPTSLTRAALDCVRGKKLKPKMKVILNRTRFILKKNFLEEDEDELASISQTSEGSTVKRQYQDDYYINLDSEIYTTSDTEKMMSFSFDTEGYDNFIFNHLSVTSNDSNLSDFKNNLSTDIQDHALTSQYCSRTLRRLPENIQRLVNNNTYLNIFKDMNLYQYMLSCYYNIIPSEQHINNHYSQLLSLNLLKNHEIRVNKENQAKEESMMFQEKSSKILSHKKSLGNIQPPQLVKNDSFQSFATLSNNSIFSTYDAASDDDYSTRFVDNTSQKPAYFSFFENFINDILRLRPSYNISQEARPLLTNSGSYYSSIYDELPYYNQDNEQRSALQSSDQMLSLGYFSFSAISIFIAGIELGIVYSLILAEDEFSRFSIFDNIGLLFVLIIGMLSSLIFSVLSINLKYQRTRCPPLYHSIIIWSGLTIVCICFLWIFFKIIRDLT